MTAIISDPLLLAVGLALAGLVWLFLAAALSAAFPSPRVRSSSSPAIPVPPVVVRQRSYLIKRYLETSMKPIETRIGLLERLNDLTRPAPAPEPLPAVRHFEDKINRIETEIRDVHSLLHRRSFNRIDTHMMEAQIQSMHLKIQTAMQSQKSRPLSPSPSSAPTVFREAPLASDGPRTTVMKDILDKARQERERYGERETLDRQESGSPALTEQVGQFRKQISDVDHEADVRREEEERLRSEERVLAQRQARIAQEQAVVSGLEQILKTQQDAKSALDGRLTMERSDLAVERTRQERRLARLTRRLSLWRTRWEQRLEKARQDRQSGEEALKSERARLARELNERQIQHEKRLKELDALRQRMQAEREKAVSSAGRSLTEHQTRHDGLMKSLRAECETLEKAIHLTKQQREQEGVRLAESIEKQRQMARDWQSQWKEQVRTHHSNAEKEKSELLRDISRAQSELQTFQKEQTESLSRREAETKRAEEQSLLDMQRLQSRVREETEALNRQESDQRSRQNLLQSELQLLTRTWEEEKADLTRRISEQKSWARDRFGALELSLNNYSHKLSLDLSSLRQQKETVEKALESERRRFRTAWDSLERSHGEKLASLQKEAPRLEQDFSTRRSELLKRQAALEEDIEGLQGKLLQIQKKTAHLREKKERILIRQRDRYESVILKLQYQMEQEKAGGEGRLAEQRLALESTRQRLLNREKRLKQALTRRQEALQLLMNEALGTVESAKRRYWDELAREREKMEQMDAERQKLEHSIQSAQKMGPHEDVFFDQRAKEERTRYEEEQARRKRELEQYGRAVLDQSSENQEKLKQMLSELTQGTFELERQERLTREFLDRVQTQVSQLKALKGRFDESAGSSSSVSSVA
ncbi:MAG TPA: hypothetical protein PK876_03515 [Elusimicrobiota bacterium]|nr:hypothetical protein [Elusimicrobiota bacterium]